jgi:hypothetical protein
MAKRNPQPRESLGLTEKQERYCQLAAFGSYADAYRQAYDCKPGAVISPAISALNRDARIALRIQQLQAEAAKPLAVDREWLLRWWFYRMTYDPAEITNWAVGCCRYCHGEGHGYQWRPAEFMRAMNDAEQAKLPLPDIGGGFGFDSRRPPAHDCPECDGRGIGRENFTDTSELSDRARAAFDGIKRTKDGIEILMADKTKAAEQFGKLSGFDVVQVKLLADDIPDAERLAELARDPMAISAAYERFLGTTH